MVSKGNHPQMAARFRLVKYYNLPRYMYIHVDTCSIANDHVSNLIQGSYTELSVNIATQSAKKSQGSDAVASLLRARRDSVGFLSTEDGNFRYGNW